MKNILITGAAGNLGTVVVDYFISKGHNVFAFVSPGKVSQKSPKAGLSHWEADLTNETATTAVINEIVQKHRKIDAAFLLAGGFAMGGIDESSLEAIHKMIAINFDTAYTVARAVHQNMNQKEGTKIVFVGSKPALELNGSSMIGYTLSKALLFNMVSILNKDSDKTKVSYSAIVPSTIDTPANRQAMPKANFNEWVKPETIARELEKILLGDNAQPVIKLY